MARKRFTAESIIIIKLREAEGGLAQGQTVGQVCRQIGVSESPNVGPAECWDRLDRPRAPALNSVPWSGLHVVPGLT